LAPITGPSTVCVNTTITLSNSISGGLWSSTNQLDAAVGSVSGIVTGLVASTQTIKYTMPTGCVTSATVTVHACGKSPDTATSVSTTVFGITDIKLFPNPNKGTFIIKGELAVQEDQDVYIEITDMLGQVVYKKTIQAQSGNINEQVQMDNTIANAMYIVSVRLGAEQKVFHIVIEK
jgi:hypothetical protein